MWPLSRPPDPNDEAARARERALARLHRAIAGERRRLRQRRFVWRALVGGLTLFIALATVPRSIDPDVQPLLGLAEAVETMSWTPVEVTSWYSRSERMELIEVSEGLLGGREMKFLLPSVHEVWTELGGVQRRRVTYGNPEFLSPEDARLFSSTDLGDHYPSRRTVESVQSIGEVASFSAEDLATPADVTEGLRRQVAGTGDRRTEEVDMLRLAALIMQTHGADPRVRGTVLRAVADIPGIVVNVAADTVDVSFDYVDGDRPLRLSYAFDAETAYLVGESLAVLATQSEPSTLVFQSRYEPLTPVTGAFGS